MRQPAVKRLAVLGALGATLGIAAPVASADPGFVPGASPLGGGVSGQAIWGSVAGPVIITTAPTSFINSNTQVSAVGNASGVQVTIFP
jgi:hypothetical protein